jgi:TatA/E family protein of Tat protein translocase
MPQLAFLMESVGMGEWIVLLAVIMIVMGPQRLPEMARKMGRWTETFRRAADEFKRQILSMDQDLEPHPPQPEEPHYPDYDYSEEHGQSPEESEHHGTVSETGEAPAAVPEAADSEPKESDAYPSEGLPDSAQYYGNEELVAGMEKEGEKKE